MSRLKNYQRNTDFIITVKTDNAGTSLSDQFTIPTNGVGYLYNVNWGDGTTSDNVTGDITHTFPSAGTYQVKISGKFKAIYFNEGGDKDKLVSIDQWGSIKWNSFDRAFYGCSNMDMKAVDTPDLTQVSNINYMFGNCISLVGNSSMSYWDVSNVAQAVYFLRAAYLFNINLNSWNVSGFVNISGMFYLCTGYNQPMNNWDVSAVQFSS